MRFLHTADWQIGMKASHVGEAGTRVRDERVAAARRVVEAARDAGADFILVAGDTFEDSGVDRVLVQKVADLLAGFSGPVYLIPGNHDPVVPGSVWDHPAWKASANVMGDGVAFVNLWSRGRDSLLPARLAVRTGRPWERRQPFPMVGSLSALTSPEGGGRAATLPETEYR